MWPAGANARNRSWRRPCRHACRIAALAWLTLVSVSARRLDELSGCAGGQYPSGDSSCLPCPADSYSNPNADACESCPAGTSTAGDDRAGPAACLGSMQGSAWTALRPAALASDVPLSDRFNAPRGVEIDPASGTVLVGDTSNHIVRKVALDGTVTTFAGTGSTGMDNNENGLLASFWGPRGIALDAASGTIYVADCDNDAIRTVDLATSAVLTLAGGVSSGFSDGTGDAAKFNKPHGIGEFPAAGRAASPTVLLTRPIQALGPTSSAVVFVADFSNHAIRTVHVDTGVVTTLAGLGPSSPALVDGTSAVATFNFPNGLIFEPVTSTVFVADTYNNVVRTVAFDPSSNANMGITTTLAGSVSGFSDAVGTNARFNYPDDVVLGTSGSLLVADASNHALRVSACRGGADDVSPLYRLLRLLGCPRRPNSPPPRLSPIPDH